MPLEPTAQPSPPPSPPPPPLAPASRLAPGLLPAGGLPQLLFGLAQPLLGLRVLLREPSLRRIALPPVLVLLVLATLVAYSDDDRDVPARIEAFVTALVSLAPVPVILFGKTYRRLAAAARAPLGLSPRQPVSPSLRSAITDAVRQSVLLAIGLVPIYFALDQVAPLFDTLSALFVALAWALGAAWALYWIVVEALDNGHTAAVAGEDESAAQDSAPDPWFVRIYQLGPLRRFADRLRSLSRPWRRELQLIADHPALALGFGLGIAALLAVPLVALFFRPAAVLGAVHLLGRVDEAERATP